MVPTSTGCSRGAETCGFGHVSGAARCLLACWRLARTPGSSSSLLAAAGVRAGLPGSAKLGAGLRARRRRRASMARRSTGACPVCSGHAVQHRQLSGRVLRTFFAFDFSSCCTKNKRRNQRERERLRVSVREKQTLSFMSHHAERISLSVVRGVNRAIRSHLATLSARLARA